MGKFQKTVENFECENCGEFVKGTGYTNHCPHCLWSKHVDKTPGDREETCGGLMEPVSVEKDGKEIFIVHKCENCGFKRRNKASEEDDIDLIIKIMSASSGVSI